jgi:hypothetical protein
MFIFFSQERQAFFLIEFKNGKVHKLAMLKNVATMVQE